MTLLTYPMQDNYKTKLSRAWNWGTGTVYVRTAPSFTMPANSFCIVTVDPWTDKEQAFVMDSFSVSNKTLNCYSISVNKWPWLAYTQKSHSVWAKVVISDNYANREAFKTDWDLKINANVTGINIGYYASKAARDAAIPSPTNGKDRAYCLLEWVRTYYSWGAWIDEATSWTTTPNADTTTAGKVELATQAENTSWASTGGTGASVFATPAVMATTLQRGERLYAGASATGNDTYVVTMTPAPVAYTTGMRLSFKTDVANTGACSINVNWLGAKNIKMPWTTDPLTNALPSWWVIDLEYDGTNMIVMWGAVDVSVRSTIVPIQRVRDAASATVTYNHNLWRVPKTAQLLAYLREDWTYWSSGVYDNVTWTPALNTFYKTGTGTAWSLTQTYAVEVWYTAWWWQRGVFQNLTATTFDIVWTKAGASAGNIDLFVTLT